MSKKVLNYAGKRPMLLAFLVMATLTLGLLFSGWLTPTPGKAQNGSQNPQPNAENCDNPTTTTNCAASAQLVLKNVTISPAAPTNAPYDCIVCVCDSVSAHLQWFTIPSTNVTQTCHTCKGSTPTNYCDAPIYTAGASPYNITNEWWNEWWYDWTNGIGDSVSFSFTNATAGEVWFDNISAMMTTNAPGCGVWVHWADNAYSGRSYAFVAVDSISPDSGHWVTNVPCDTYLVQFCPSNYVTVTASPDPGMDDKFLPAGWSMSGGLATTNADGSPSRTKRLVDTGTVGSVTVTATSGCSSKSVKIIVYQAKVELDAYTGDCGLNPGHSWWNLTVQPSDVYPFLKKSDGSDLSQYLGTGGYTCDGGNLCCLSGFCDGSVEHPESGYDTNCSYWWCISFGGLINALTYVGDLISSPGKYNPTYNNCTTEAEAVGNYAWAPIGFSGSFPCDLCDYLNTLPFPEKCSCQ
jgi:hypothetical protein